MRISCDDGPRLAARALGCIYEAYEEYPNNLLRHSDYDPNLLNLYSQQLNDQSTSVFEKSDYLKIPIRDILADGTVFKQNILELEHLKRWLSGALLRGRGVSDTMPASMKDPNCRFMSVVSQKTALVPKCFP